MKICWDNLEGVRINGKGNFVKNKTIYIEAGPCRVCGDIYLREKRNRKHSGYCSKSCSSGDRTMSESLKRKLSAIKSGKKMPEAVKLKISASLIGRKKSDKTKLRISNSQLGEKNHRFGKKPHNYNGVRDNGNTLYDTYSKQLSIYVDVRRSITNNKLLELKCYYCGNWFSPSCNNVKNRLSSINFGSRGENGFYCSDNCKAACPIFNQSKYPKGFKKASSREVNPLVRQLCLKRDNWQCQICGATQEDDQLHCHHIEGVAKNPRLGNDVTNCITLCKTCHKQVHKLPGCGYSELKCKKQRRKK